MLNVYKYNILHVCGELLTTVCVTIEIDRKVRMD